MLPILFNEYPSRLVQVAMKGNVGYASMNSFADVVLIQSLLNNVSSDQGGAGNSLAIDGAAGPLTIASIQQYQQARSISPDGWIGVGGPTIMMLVRELNAQNMLPVGLPNLCSPDPAIINGLSDQNPVAIQSQLDTDNLAQVPQGFNSGSPTTISGLSTVFPPTGWSIVSSGGFDVSVLIFGGTVINIYMNHDSEPGATYMFRFVGVGVGLSALPVGLDVSFAQMPSWGTTVRKGFEPGAKNPPFGADEFHLLPVVILSIAGSVGPGWSGTLLFFGAGSLVSVALTRYVAAMTGMQAGMPGLSGTMYVGAIVS